MMFRENFVVAIKVNGKVLREEEGRVALPFGSEYSILIKNLNSVKSQVSISVDGVVASGYGCLIINPSSDIELERFIRDGNLNSGNRFKFIERTAEIEAHRGVGAEDGLVRVEAWKGLRVPPPPPSPHNYYPSPHCPRPTVPPRPDRSAPLHKGSIRPIVQMRAAGSSMRRPSSVVAASAPRAPGITVPGSHSNQGFRTVSGFALEPQSTVMVLHLTGQIGEALVTEPLTVHDNPVCSTCGKTNRSKNKFCFACGTSLQLI